ncbi:hypothetical protein HY623_02845 [Candidatus Uhrbacteria bacterium]|nr:hypothetical protein [Candidatus Uhrbacteria bacterium]
MQQLFQIRFVHWAAYVGLFLVGLVAAAVGLWFENISENYQRLIILCFAVFALSLFFVFSFLNQKKWAMPNALFTLFTAGHGLLLVVGFGIIPTILYNQTLVDNQYLLFAPTNLFSLVVASATAFFCYWILSGTIAALCRYRGRTLFFKAIETVRENKSLIGCIGAIAISLVVVFGSLVSSEALFFLELPILPFATYVFMVFADTFFAVLCALIFGAYAFTCALLICKSMHYEGATKKTYFFQSIVFLSRHFFIINLILWAIYMYALGVIFEIGSWGPFQII